MSSIVFALHQDTTEIIAWSQSWAWTYPKHPPMAVWLFSLISSISFPWLPSLLIFSQLLVGLTSFFIWKTIRLYRSRFTAGIAVFFFMESAVATYFSIQMNHNSIMLPFVSALLFFGLKYLEHQKTKDAVFLALSTAGAFLSKYESVIIIVFLLGLSLGIPRFRIIWRQPATYMAGLLALACVSPHLYNEWQLDWPNLVYATDTRPIETWRHLASSINRFINAVFIVVILPLFTLCIFIYMKFVKISWAKEQRAIGAIMAFGPTPLLFVVSLVLMQIFRQGWLLPLIPSFIVGSVLLINMTPGERATLRSLKIWATGLSIVQFIGFSMFLWACIFMGNPVSAYSFDSAHLTQYVQSVWRTYSKEPLTCIIAPNSNIGLSPLLHLPKPIQFVALNSETFMFPRDLPCTEKGGIIILPSDKLYDDVRAHLMRKTLPEMIVHIAPHAWRKFGKWTFNIFFIPAQKRPAPS